MAQRDALLGLHSRLVARRDALRNALAGDWESHRRFTAMHEVGDTVDAALDSASEEISSRFVEIESRELELIEHALQRIVEGVYGRCEYCSVKITATRLNAVPYTSSCIDCQSANERNGRLYGSRISEKRWARVYEKPSLEESDRKSPIRLRDFEMELSE